MAFVISSGSLMSVEKAVAVAPISSISVGQQSRAYEALWRAQPELRTVIDFIARNIAQLPLHVFERVSDVDRRRLTDHPMAELLAQPNPSTTRYRLIDALVHDLCIYDSAFWVKVRGEAGQPLLLRRIPPTRVTPDGEDWLEASRYTIRGSRGSITVEADDVVHFHGYNARDGRIGTSPIESLRNILAEEWAANVYREALWRNGARVSGYLKRPVDAPEWSTGARRRFRSEWQAQWAGDSPHAGGTPILEDGMDFVPAAVSPRDAEYVASRKLTREEVARSYHVPLPMVGILDHATFSNIREQHKQLYQDCLGPWLEQIQEEIELQLLPDLTAGQTNVYVEFTIAEKLRGSFEEQAAQLQASVGGPYMTRNEARARLNLPQLDGGDELIVPLNVTAGTDAPAPDDTAAARAARQKATDYAPALRRYFARQGQVALSAAGAPVRPSADALIHDRWDAELAIELARVDWLAAGSINETAKNINAATRAELRTALTAADPVKAVRTLFAGYVDNRAAQLAAELARAAA